MTSIPANSNLPNLEMRVDSASTSSLPWAAAIFSAAGPMNDHAASWRNMSPARSD